MSWKGNEKRVKQQGWSRLDHKERACSGETVAAIKVKKTSTKEKIQAQDTSKIGTEIENMHENNCWDWSGNEV